MSSSPWEGFWERGDEDVAAPFQVGEGVGQEWGAVGHWLG
jgi:hypothetical protein